MFVFFNPETALFKVNALENKRNEIHLESLLVPMLPEEVMVHMQSLVPELTESTD